MKTQPIGHPERNWPEGAYLCSCVDCKLPFTGHKRQHTCRKCQEAADMGNPMSEAWQIINGLLVGMLISDPRWKPAADWLAANRPPLNTRTPPPTVWHRASEKLPEEKDGDICGQIWVYGEYLSSPQLWRAANVVATWKSQHPEHREDFFWTPTNFTKPKPPEV